MKEVLLQQEDEATMLCMLIDLGVGPTNLETGPSVTRHIVSLHVADKCGAAALEKILD